MKRHKDAIASKPIIMLANIPLSSWSAWSSSESSLPLSVSFMFSSCPSSIALPPPVPKEKLYVFSIYVNDIHLDILKQISLIRGDLSNVPSSSSSMTSSFSSWMAFIAFAFSFLLLDLRFLLRLNALIWPLIQLKIDKYKLKTSKEIIYFMRLHLVEDINNIFIQYF